MKTFEERYTAWLDGQLAGAELAAFEQELARRGEMGDAEADRADCGRLRLLLQAQLRAPELSNQDFFSLQVRQRIDADRQPSRATSPAEGSALPGLFPWPGSRMFGAGLAFVALAAVLFLVIIPHQGAPEIAPSANLAQAASVAAGVPAPPAPVGEHNPPAGNDLMARNDATGPADLTVTVPVDAAAAGTAATPLHYRQPNVNVLWINGLDYIPAVPGTDDDGAPAAAGSPVATIAPERAATP